MTAPRQNNGYFYIEFKDWENMKHYIFHGIFIYLCIHEAVLNGEIHLNLHVAKSIMCSPEENTQHAMKDGNKFKL